MTNRLFLCFHCTHFCNFFVFGVFVRGTSFADRPYSFRATGFGSYPYFSASPTSINPHLLEPKQEGGKHQTRAKPRLTSSYLYANSQHHDRIACFSLVQHVQNEHQKADNEQAYTIHIQSTEGEKVRLS